MTKWRVHHKLTPACVFTLEGTVDEVAQQLWERG